jgi:hypothetical protein
MESAGQSRPVSEEEPAFLRGPLVKGLSQPAALTGVDEPGCPAAAIPWALVCSCGRWLPTWRLNPGPWPIRRVATPESALARALETVDRPDRLRGEQGPNGRPDRVSGCARDGERLAWLPSASASQSRRLGHPGRAIPSGFGRQRRPAEPERERHFEGGGTPAPGLSAVGVSLSLSGLPTVTVGKPLSLPVLGTGRCNLLRSVNIDGREHPVYRNRLRHTVAARTVSAFLRYRRR